MKLAAWGLRRCESTLAAVWCRAICGSTWWDLGRRTAWLVAALGIFWVPAPTHADAGVAADAILQGWSADPSQVRLPAGALRDDAALADHSSHAAPLATIVLARNDRQSEDGTGKNAGRDDKDRARDKAEGRRGRDKEDRSDKAHADHDKGGHDKAHADHAKGGHDKGHADHAEGRHDKGRADHAEGRRDKTRDARAGRDRKRAEGRDHSGASRSRGHRDRDARRAEQRHHQPRHGDRPRTTTPTTTTPTTTTPTTTTPTTTTRTTTTRTTTMPQRNVARSTPPSTEPGNEDDDERSDLRVFPLSAGSDNDNDDGGVGAGVGALNEFAGDYSFVDVLDAAAAVLGTSLESPDPRDRRRTVAALGRFNAAIAQALPVLFDALCSKDPRVQKRAALILAGVEDYAAAVVPALSQRITSDSDAAVARASVQALGNLGVYAIDGLPTLVDALDHADMGVRYYAGDSVGSVDDQMTVAAGAIRKIALRCGDNSGTAVQQLVAKLAPDRAAMRQKATQSLAGIGQAAPLQVAQLTAGAQGGPEDRERTVQGLSDVARFSSAAVASLAKDGSAPGEWAVAVGASPLADALGDEQGEVRQAATEGFRVASREVTSASMVLQQTPKNDLAVRRATHQALETIDAYGEVAVPALLAALKDDDVAVRRAAAQAIGEMGPQAEATAPALLDAMKSESPEVRAEAALALGRIHDDSAATVPTLAAALDNPEPAVRYQAARALGLLGGGATPAVPRLQAALDQPDVAMRYRAARALRAIDPASADGIGKADEQDFASLLDALKSGDPQGRRHAGQMLGNLGPAAVATLPQLAADLAAAPPASREELAGTMHEITESALAEVPELIAELQAGGPGADRAAAALGAFGNDAKLAKQDLIEGLDDPDPEVRLTVAEVLGDISDYSSRVIGALMIEALKDDEPALAALQRHTS